MLKSNLTIYILSTYCKIWGQIPNSANLSFFSYRHFCRHPNKTFFFSPGLLCWSFLPSKCLPFPLLDLGALLFMPHSHKTLPFLTASILNTTKTSVTENWQKILPLRTSFPAGDLRRELLQYRYMLLTSRCPLLHPGSGFEQNLQGTSSFGEGPFLKWFCLGWQREVITCQEFYCCPSIEFL